MIKDKQVSLCMDSGFYPATCALQKLDTFTMTSPLMQWAPRRAPPFPVTSCFHRSKESNSSEIPALTRLPYKNWRCGSLELSSQRTHVDFRNRDGVGKPLQCRMRLATAHRPSIFRGTPQFSDTRCYSDAMQPGISARSTDQQLITVLYSNDANSSDVIETVVSPKRRLAYIVGPRLLPSSGVKDDADFPAFDWSRVESRVTESQSNDTEFSKYANEDDALCNTNEDCCHLTMMGLDYCPKNHDADVSRTYSADTAVDLRDAYELETNNLCSMLDKTYIATKKSDVRHSACKVVSDMTTTASFGWDAPEFWVFPEHQRRETQATENETCDEIDPTSYTAYRYPQLKDAEPLYLSATQFGNHLTGSLSEALQHKTSDRHKSMELGYHCSTQSGVSSSACSTPSSCDASVAGATGLRGENGRIRPGRSQQWKTSMCLLKSPETAVEEEFTCSGGTSYYNGCFENMPEKELCDTSGIKKRRSLEPPCSRTLELVERQGIALTFVLNPAELQFFSTVEKCQPGTTSSKLSLVTINTGTFCTVYKARYKLQTVAVKCPQQNHVVGDATMMRMRAIKELRILSKMGCHPNILKLFGGVVVSDSEIWIVTEFIHGGDLYSRLYYSDSQRRFSATQRLSIMKQLAAAVAHLHASTPCVVHKDLKTNNVLITEKNDVRLCDFGDAEEIEHGGCLRVYTAVTWQYASPEIIMSKDPSAPDPGTNEKVDIWSLGCIFLELCYRPTPFWHVLESLDPSEHQEALQRHLHVQYGCLPSVQRQVRTNLPGKLRRLLETCLHFDASQRPSAAQVGEYLVQNGVELEQELVSLEPKENVESISVASLQGLRRHEKKDVLPGTVPFVHC